MTEADTRSKLIDPVFISVLGWTEAEIRREKQSPSGYVDYVLGADTAHLLVEAKRTKPRFRLEAPSKPRRLKLDGAHLLKQKKMRTPLEQAQRYASDLGAQVAVLTNGSQWILFRPYLPGRSWTSGVAIAFHDSDDVLQDFALFHSLLCRDSVVAGDLLDSFEQIEGITESLHTPIQFVRDPDGDLVRNPFWSKISNVVAPLFTDQAEDLRSQEEVIRNCYVSTRLSDQADRSLDRLLQDIPTPHLADAGVGDTGATRTSAFSHQFERDIEDYRPGTYVLTGGVGSGKTTFLRRFALVVNPQFLQEYCVWSHIDFLTFGNVDESTVAASVPSFIYKELRSRLETNYPDWIPSDGEEVRSLFRDELDKARKVKLYGIPEDSTEWNAEVGRLMNDLYESDERFVTAIFKEARRRGLRIVLVLDNTDQQGELFQEQVFLFAQKLSKEHKALCVVTLREERFFAAFRRGIFDAFGDRKFHIGSPDLKKVLRKRLEFARQRFASLAKEGSLQLDEQDRKRVDLLLGTLIRSASEKNGNIVRMLACMSNGDMRHALDMFREFVCSGNTNVVKIIEIVERSGGYTVPFHEFSKSAILGSKRYYRSGRSHILNLFKKSSAPRASHLSDLRILARLTRAEGAASQHGDGFVSTSKLLQEWRASFGQADDFAESAGELLRRGLLESEPPKIPSVVDSTALRISASGSYYWRYLCRAFSYVDLVWIDTPLSDSELARRLAALAESSDMEVRFERVRAFVDFLADQERIELIEVTQRSGPYRDAVMPEIQEQLESEISIVAKKTRTSDRHGKTEARTRRPTSNRGS
ncbi:MAG: hypothetical protein ACQGVK_09400 [Myxococcota bacterium]